jgi:heme exporter protein B
VTSPALTPAIAGRAPGFLSVVRTVAAKDLRLEWRTFETLSASAVFALVVLVVFEFAVGDTGPALAAHEGFAPGALWIAVAFAAVTGASRSAALERHDQVIAAVLAAPVDRSALFAGKALANAVKLAAVSVALLIAVALLFDVPLLLAPVGLAVVLVVHGLGLVALGTLFAAVASRVGRGEALLATLLLPAAAPLLLSAVATTRAVLAGRPLGAESRWLLLALGFDLLYTLLGLLTFELVMEE